MSLSRTQIEAWDPTPLSGIGNAWMAMGKTIEDLFDRYKAAVANVNGGHWQGLAADATAAQADSDRRAAIRLVDHLDRAATLAIDGFHTIDSSLRDARNAIAGAEHAGFTVAEDLTVFKIDMATIDEQQLMQQWQTAITEAATAAENADSDVQRELAAARGDLQVAFVSPETLAADQARSDAQQMLNDPAHLTPLTEQRLADAGLLTCAQLAALQCGEPVTISAAQMEYLNALARSLDNTSPRDIAAMMTKLPPDARQGVANALQLLSTPAVTSSVAGDAQIPATGAITLLPQHMSSALTRKDLTTQQWQIVGDWPYNAIALNGVADNQANAAIAGMSSPALKHATGLDTAVFDAAAGYLHAQVTAQQHPDDLYSVDGRGQEPNAALTEPMFAAVADDKAVVAAHVTGPTGQAFLSEVLTDNWRDHGKSVAQLFDIGPQGAVATPADPPSAVHATESGQIAATVAHYLGDHQKQLLDLPDNPGTAVGQRNPDLMIGLASDLAPYYSTFAGSDSIRGVAHFENSRQLADMYSVLATNPTAGVDAAVATWGQQNALATAYGAGTAPSTYGQIAGQMQHALQTGTASAQTALNQGDTYRANWHEAVDGSNYDMAYKAAGAVLGNIPAAGSTIKDLFNVIGPGLKPDIVGIVDPSAVANPANGIPYQHAANQLDTDTTVQDIVDGLVVKDPTVLNDPALAAYRHTDAHGNRFITVDNLTSQAVVSDRLNSRYGLDVQQWEDQFDTGMNGGTIVAAR